MRLLFNTKQTLLFAYGYESLIVYDTTEIEKIFFLYEYITKSLIIKMIKLTADEKFIYLANDYDGIINTFIYI